MERLAHIATVSGVQFVNERARRPFESAWRLSSTGLLEAFRLIFGLLAQLVELPEARVFVVGSNPTLVVIKWVARNGRRTCPKPCLKGRKRDDAPERRGGLLEWRNW